MDDDQGDNNNNDQPGADVQPGDDEPSGDDVEQPGDDVEQPGDDVEQPGDDVEQPGDEVEQPEDDVEQRGDDVEQPSNSGELSAQMDSGDPNEKNEFDDQKRQTTTSDDSTASQVAHRSQKHTESSSTDDSPEKKYSAMIQKMAKSSTSTDASLERRFSVQNQKFGSAPTVETSLDSKTPYSTTSTDDSLTKRYQKKHVGQISASGEESSDTAHWRKVDIDFTTKQDSIVSERLSLWKEKLLKEVGLWERMMEGKETSPSLEDLLMRESLSSTAGSSAGETSDSSYMHPKLTTTSIFDNPWKRINVLRHHYDRAASREKKLRQRLYVQEVSGPPGPFTWQDARADGADARADDARADERAADEESEGSECVCKLGEPQNMYAKGHAVSCKVWYPTTDPCLFTEEPGFRGHMRFTRPCGPPPPRTRKKPLYKPPYEPRKKQHFRHTLLLEELQRIERERCRVRVLTPWQRIAQTNQLRKEIPVLGPRHIRQYRQPFHEWIVLELDETDFPATASFFRHLLKMGETLQKATRDLTFKWENLRLEDYPDIAKMLVQALIDCETHMKATPPNFEGAIEALIGVSLKLMGVAAGLYWVVEQVLLRAIKMSSRYKRDSSHKEALVRYVYAFLLAEKLEDHAKAQEQLEEARSLSLSKKWTIDYPELEVQFKVLNVQCTYYLCRVMVQRAKDVRAADTLTSIKILSRALRFLGDPALVEIQANVLLELGVSYEMMGEFRMAHVVMQRYLEIPNRSLEPPGKCSAYLEMAFCHRLLGENSIAEAYLRETLRTAKQAQSRELNAVAHKYVGIGYMAMGYNKKASRHLERSFRGFLELGLSADLDYVRVVSAISKGTEVLPFMAELLNETVDAEDATALKKLGMWMNRHQPFWNEKADDVPELYSMDLYNVIRTRAPPPLEDLEQAAPEETMAEEEDTPDEESVRLLSFLKGIKFGHSGSMFLEETREPRESLLKKRGGGKWLPRKEKGQTESAKMRNSLVG